MVLNVIDLCTHESTVSIRRKKGNVRNAGKERECVRCATPRIAVVSRTEYARSLMGTERNEARQDVLGTIVGDVVAVDVPLPTATE